VSVPAYHTLEVAERTAIREFLVDENGVHVRWEDSFYRFAK